MTGGVGRIPSGSVKWMEVIMADFIVGLIVFVLFSAAVTYIYKKKKSGVKCIGCPDAPACAGKCASCCGCTPQDAKDDNK